MGFDQLDSNTLWLSKRKPGRERQFWMGHQFASDVTHARYRQLCYDVPGIRERPSLLSVFPDGYRIAPHWHPAVERVSVIAGTFQFGMGETFDQSRAKALPAGSFVFMPPKMAHFAWVEGETILQLTGEGPWGITYLNPSDDPRQMKKSEK